MNEPDTLREEILNIITSANQVYWQDNQFSSKGPTPDLWIDIIIDLIQQREAAAYEQGKWNGNQIGWKEGYRQGVQDLQKQLREMLLDCKEDVDVCAEKLLTNNQPNSSL